MPSSSWSYSAMAVQSAPYFSAVAKSPWSRAATPSTHCSLVRCGPSTGPASRARWA
ncbi:hypothetical protein SMICM304S_02934 [Streptomyces microflavus]